MRDFTINNVSLNTREDFKKFFQYLADGREIHLTDFICEFFEYQDFVIKTFEEDEIIETFNDNFDEFYLGNYYIDIQDSWDRVGDVKIRQAIKIESKETDVTKYLKELSQVKQEYLPLHETYCKIFDTKDKELMGTFDFERYETLRKKFNKLQGIYDDQ